MSVENVGTHFVDDLVNMALTAKRVPELEARIRELETANALNEAAVVELNKQIIDHVNAHAETKSRLTSAEAERDSTTFRISEEKDKVSLLSMAIRDCQTTLADVLAAIEPVKEPEPRPDYSGKWLTDVPGWSRMTLCDWEAGGGSSYMFTIVKPSFPNEPVDVHGSVTDRLPSPVIPAVADLESPLSTPPAPAQSAPETTTQDQGSGEGERATDPTAETLLGSSSLTAPYVGGDQIASASVPPIEPTEVAPSTPFAPTTDNQSANVHTGGAETKDNANSPNEPSRPEWDYWAVQSQR